MANEFIARRGLISSGSINVSGSVTASFFKGDGSQLINLPESSLVINTDNHIFVGNGITTNYTLSSSYDISSLYVSVAGLTYAQNLDYTISTNILTFLTAPPSESNIVVKALVNATTNVQGTFTGSFLGLITSASYATTASYALNAGAGAGFPYSGSAVITGSLLVIPTGSVGGITGSVSGALTGTFPYNSLTSIPSDIVSSSTQVKTFLPNGTISASAQYPGWVTASSQIDYNSIQNKLSGVVSSSAQIQPLLPNGTVSSSAQYPGWVTASSQITWSSVNYNSGIVSSSAQVKTLLPDGTISSSAQYPGWVTASSQVDITATTNYTTFSSSLATVDVNQTTRIDNLASLTSSYAINSTIQSQLQGVVSTSAQVKPLLPSGILSSSAQYPGWVTSSTQIDYNSIQNKLSGVVSSSTQVAPLLPNGTVSSSAQYPGWVTSSLQINTGSFSGSITTASYTPNLYITSSLSAPSNPKADQLWYDENTGKTYIYYISASVGSWVLQADPTYDPGPLLQDFQDVTDLGATTTNALVITNTTAAVSSGSGALIISGGLGVIGSAWVNELYANTLNGRLLGAADSSSYVTFTNVDNKPTLVSSSAQIDYNSIQNKLSGVVSSSTQVQPLLPNGTVTSSAQYPGWVTSSTQIDYNSIQNKLSGVVSSSTQVAPLLPNGTVSSSVQYPGWVTASSQIQLDAITGVTFSNQSFYFPNNLRVEGTLTAQEINTEYVSSSIIYESGSSKFGDTADDVMSVTGSIRVLGGNISGSFIGLLSSSEQVDYNSIQNKLSGVVSSSTQIQPLLPNGTVSSSVQYPGWVTASSQIDITVTTNYTTFSSSLATVDAGQNIRIDNLASLTSSYAINSTIQSQLAGVVSSSTQVQPLLPGGTVSSSAQYPGWVTASSQIDYNNIQNKLSGVVSSSTQVQPLLPGGTVSSSAQYPGWVTASSQIDYNSIQNKLSGVISSSTQFNALSNTSASYALSSSYAVTSSFAQQAFSAVSASWAPSSEGQTVTWNSVTNKPEGLVSSSTQFNSTTLPFTGSFTGSLTGSLFGTSSWAISASWAPGGAGTVTSITAGDGLTGGTITGTGTITVDTGSTHFRTGTVKALPIGTVSSSAQYPGWVTASSQIDYNLIQNKLSDVVSSSTQVAQLLPGGTVSSSAQYPGWVTASSQVDITATTGYTTFSSSLATVDAGQNVRIDNLASLTSSYAINSTIQSQLAGVVSSSAQVKPLLPNGTVSSSAQYPGWVTASSQIDYNSIQNKLSGVVSSSTQFNALSNTSASYAFTASYAANAGVSGLTTKAGSITNTSFAGIPRKAAVNFVTAFPNTNYAVTITGEDARSWTIEGKVVGGFTASANSNTALTGTTYWTAIAYGET